MWQYSFSISSLAGSKVPLVKPLLQTVDPAYGSVSEDEVIAEFLKSDWNHREISRGPGCSAADHIQPQLSTTQLKMQSAAHYCWPGIALCGMSSRIGTEWHEVRVNEQALNQVRVFPRAHWRKLAQGNYSVTWVTEGLRAGRHALDERFLSKITAIGRATFPRRGAGFGTVILLGMNECEPLTVLDGNHRLVAAMLLSPGDLSRLRFVCGFSPRMTECCWYKTNVATLFRYAKARVGAGDSQSQSGT